MEQDTFSLEAATRALEVDGFFDLGAAVGEPLLEIERRHFPYASAYGLDFCKQHVLDDKNIRSIIKSVFEKCVLAHWLRYEAYPDHTMSFMRGGQKAGRHALMVHLWPKGSEVVYFTGSHLVELPARKGRRLLWEAEEQILLEAGCQPVRKNFEDGGSVILDARSWYKMQQGYAIKFEFVEDDLVKDWPKMALPKSDVLIKKVASMQSPEIGVNFIFIEQ